MNYRMNVIQWVEYFLLKTVRKDTLSLKRASVSTCERDSISTNKRQTMALLIGQLVGPARYLRAHCCKLLMCFTSLDFQHSGRLIELGFINAKDITCSKDCVDPLINGG